MTLSMEVLREDSSGRLPRGVWTGVPQEFVAGEAPGERT
jgi:hypothetical protein